MLTITKTWTDDDTLGAALYNDGYRLAFNAESVVLIAPDGTIAHQSWKVEPLHEHYALYKETVGTPQPTEMTGEMIDAIFDAGHYGSDQPKAVEGAKRLAALLV